MICTYPIPVHEMLSRLQEAVHHFELCYTTKDLYRAGIENEDDLTQAMAKTLHLLKNAGVDIGRFMKQIYITEIESGRTYPDWKINKVSFFLVILHSESDNPLISKWKQQILQYITGEEIR